MGSIGVTELIFIFVLALLIFGPRKLPELGRTLGKALGEFRKASTDLRAAVEDEMREIEREAKEAETQAREAIGPATQPLAFSEAPVGAGSIDPQNDAPGALGAQASPSGENVADGAAKPA